MRLRDKKCGETHDYGFSNGDDGSICVGQDGDFETPTRFNSLSELCERFEDVPEEIKPFEEVAKVGFKCDIATVRPGVESTGWISIADQDYYEILPDGTKKMEFTWDEAMEIEKKTNGKWRIPTQAEWFAIAVAFGADKDGKVTGETLAKNLNLTTDEGGCGNFWSSTVRSATNAYDLGFGSTYVNAQYYSSKAFSFTVRCVAREGEQNGKV